MPKTTRSSVFFTLIISITPVFASTPTNKIADRIRNQCDRTLWVSNQGCLQEVRKQVQFFHARLNQAAIASSPKRNQSAVALSLVQDAQLRLGAFARSIDHDEVLQAELNQARGALDSIARRLIDWNAQDRKQVPQTFQRINDRLSAISRELGV